MASSRPTSQPASQPATATSHHGTRLLHTKLLPPFFQFPRGQAGRLRRISVFFDFVIGMRACMCRQTKPGKMNTRRSAGSKRKKERHRTPPLDAHICKAGRQQARRCQSPAVRVVIFLHFRDRLRLVAVESEGVPVAMVSTVDGAVPINNSAERRNALFEPPYRK